MGNMTSASLGNYIDGMDGPQPEAATEPPIHSYITLGLEGLVKATKFSREDIQRMYRGFKKECPNGLLDQDTFLGIFYMLFPGGDPSLYCNRLFLTFDRKKRGKLTFEDFVLALSRCLHGDNKEVLTWAFEVYDIEGKGYLTQNELFCILSSIYNLIGVKISGNDEGSLMEPTKELFQMLDVDGDGRIGLEEFVSGCLKNPDLVEALNNNSNDDETDVNIVVDCSDNDSVFSFNQSLTTGTIRRIKSRSKLKASP